MHLFIFIGVLVLCYLVYAVLRTQRRVDAELREIRKKCVGGVSTSLVPEENVVKDASSKLTSGLEKLMSLTI